MSADPIAVIVGTIREVSTSLYDELLTSGSSVLLDDVITLMITNTKKYAGWSGELQPEISIDPLVRPRLVIDETTILKTSDWIIIEPVARAHCDLVQARRVEGAQGLGVQPSGMSSSEALQLYKDALIQMQKDAFQCQPFSIETPDDVLIYPFRSALWRTQLI